MFQGVCEAAQGTQSPSTEERSMGRSVSTDRTPLFGSWCNPARVMDMGMRRYQPRALRALVPSESNQSYS